MAAAVIGSGTTILSNAVDNARQDEQIAALMKSTKSIERLDQSLTTTRLAVERLNAQIEEMQRYMGRKERADERE